MFPPEVLSFAAGCALRPQRYGTGGIKESDIAAWAASSLGQRGGAGSLCNCGRKSVDGFLPAKQRALAQPRLGRRPGLLAIRQKHDALAAGEPPHVDGCLVAV